MQVIRKIGPEGSEMHRDGVRPPCQALAPPLDHRPWMLEKRTKGIFHRGPTPQPGLPV